MLLTASGSSLASTGVAFLKIPNGTAEIGLGQSGVSHASGGSAAWWNPALIASGDRGLSLQLFRWIGDSRGTFTAGSFKTSWGGVSAYLFDLSIPDFEARDIPGPAVGFFTVHQSVLALATAAQLPHGLQAGVALKGWMDDIYGDHASDFPILDAGLTWQRGALTAGLAGSNLSLSKHSREPLPQTLRLGGTYRPEMEDYSFLGTGELSYVKGRGTALHVGAEGGWKARFYLRAGWMGGNGISRPSFGLGVMAGSYMIDAALTMNEEALGTTWRMGVGMKL